MEKRFEMLDIAPADAAFKAYGESMEETFSNAAVAMMSVMTEISKVEEMEKVELDATGYDLNSLMFDWLSNILYIVSAEGFSSIDREYRHEFSRWGRRANGSDAAISPGGKEQTVA